MSAMSVLKICAAAVTALLLLAGEVSAVPSNGAIGDAVDLSTDRFVQLQVDDHESWQPLYQLTVQFWWSREADLCEHRYAGFMGDAYLAEFLPHQFSPISIESYDNQDNIMVMHLNVGDSPEFIDVRWPSAPSNDTDTWHHFTVVWDGTAPTFTVYINGVKATPIHASDLSSFTPPVAINAESLTGNNHPATLGAKHYRNGDPACFSADEWRWWTRSLTEYEAADNFNRPLTCEERRDETLGFYFTFEADTIDISTNPNGPAMYLDQGPHGNHAQIMRFRSNGNYPFASPNALVVPASGALPERVECPDVEQELPPWLIYVYLAGGVLVVAGAAVLAAGMFRRSPSTSMTLPGGKAVIGASVSTSKSPSAVGTADAAAAAAPNATRSSSKPSGKHARRSSLTSMASLATTTSNVSGASEYGVGDFGQSDPKIRQRLASRDERSEDAVAAHVSRTLT